MYFASVLLLLPIFPLASIAVEAIRFGHSITDMSLIGEWFVFWAVGIRLFVVGLRQVFQPSFTAVEIFEIHEPKAFAIVRELGFANLSMGLLGVGSLWHKESLIPAAIVGGLYYGLAGLGHVPRPHKNAKEYTAIAAEAAIGATIPATSTPCRCGAFAPSVIATEIEPGPTVSGNVRG